MAKKRAVKWHMRKVAGKRSTRVRSHTRKSGKQVNNFLM